MIFKKIPDKNVGHILTTYEPSDEILAVVTPQMSPDEFLQTAIAHNLYLDAVIFVAHALPLRESIYWAYLTVEFLKDKFSPQELQVLASVKEWFSSPDDLTRRQNGQLAEDLKLKTGPAWLAEAVFWSGGSILPPESPATEPPSYLYAKAVIGAISLSISLEEEDPNVIKNNYIHVLKLGFNLAQGGNGVV